MQSQQNAPPASGDDAAPQNDAPQPPIAEEPAQKATSGEQGQGPGPVTETLNDAVEAPKLTQQTSSGNDVLYCICRSKDETAMIQCDKCNEWFHFRCMNILTPVSTRDTSAPPNFNFCDNKALAESLLCTTLLNFCNLNLF